ncbi:helix-turn-helix domain-containing protein [Candidatus Enterococcus ferrettii]|uniref:Mga helix-turn-helix domain-containing protein n=1 Tax=Candidatus Enterococcus ferrettii TaxID=2815324 RepID=A0ABV0EKH0_9ENTE|nr:helix-turn-helix domain-containing protein [Enterococcus sp. 665A]MBO1339977.1 helix-turn-helix domain-containing protein [Enterococcus sp. 665A]
MKTLLSNSANRQVLIIEQLKYSDEWVPVKQIVESIDASPKTIIRDCEDIEERWGHIVSIQRSASSALHLTEKKGHTVSEIFSEMIQESVAFQLLEKIIFFPGKSRLELQEELFISSANLYRQIIKMNEVLASFGVYIDRTNVCLSGENEIQTRIFLAIYFSEAYDYNNWPFPTVERAKVEQLVEKMTSVYPQELSLPFLIGATILRQNQGFVVSDSHMKKKKYHMDVYHFFLLNIQGVLPELVQKELYLDFASTILWRDFSWDNREEELRIEKLCKESIQLVAEVLNLKNSEANQQKCIYVLKSFYCLFKTYPHKNYLIYNRCWSASKTIHKRFAVFNKVLEKNLRDLETHTKIPWYSVYYVFILFELFIAWEDLPQQLYALRQPVSVEIASNRGLDHAQLLGYCVERNLNDKVLVNINPTLTKSETREVHHANFDLCVTNFLAKSVPKEKLFIVEDIPSAKNLTSLQDLIEKHRMEMVIEQLTYLE